MSLILTKLNESVSKGALLEWIVYDLFTDMNFSNVRRQKGGSQYGYDVVGYKDDKCWKAECKNLSAEATINDIAPKLVWHYDSDNVQRFVIVSMNGISNDLYHLLEKQLFSFPIEIWAGEFLEKIISESPSALKRLEIEKPLLIKNVTPLIFEANDLRFEVFYSRGLPFSYDYFKLGDKVVKAYSEVDFRLTAVLTNTTNRTFTVQEIIVRTLRYESTDNMRILRQFKQKGNIEPLRLVFTPKHNHNGETYLNEDNLLLVKSNTEEFIEFKLSGTCKPGYYELIFEINCLDRGRSFSLCSTVFPLHKKSNRSDMTSLCIIGKYYDTPVLDILNLDSKLWHKIKRNYDYKIKFLGQTDNDLIQNKEIGSSWTINLLKGKKEKENGATVLTVKTSRQSELLMDLKIPIEEKIFTIKDANNEVYSRLRYIEP